ncbi:MAG TPA: LLM class flavin-dependent oxidoreductase [Ramlibacter sp.]|jgi:luciferase family oxidoreductase group 1|uniref:LLM class flavin-dependent oxidoreductase n=1 Tax=Ramlibacter sp. TaxID=1917967 RepID=UPI002D49B034|nr:LLM class flavin-dependent oxidoreductase [Ramlibacter sp.]HZY20586.1 LLM class flavin-dependent oxidoreductase [Ramlibacter sp.]
MTPPLRLSVLDQSVARAGRPHDESIRHTVSLAERCEELGYQRFWLSEHHALPTLVGTAPEVLMAAIAARTRRIRIGSAGVMLPHYSPFKVAEQFRVLDALAPGRIDLGVGRAPGGDQRTARLLNPDAQSAASFPQQVLELKAWVSGEDLPVGHPGHGVRALPTGATAPQLWMLGSSGYGAQLAGHYGMPYAFAHFITDGEGCEQALALYRSTFRPGLLARPQATVCLAVLAAPTQEEAWHLFKSRERARIDRRSGRFGPLLPPEEAAREYDSAEQIEAEMLRGRAIVGSSEQVRDRLLVLAAKWQLDELVLVTWAWDPAAQRRSYELLAQAFELA